MIADWEHALCNVVEEFAPRLRTTKGSLARALGFGRDLSQSTLSRPGAYDRVCACLTAPNVPDTAAALGLPLERYTELEHFFQSAIRAVEGWDVDVAFSRGALRESVDWGVVGVSLFREGRWNEASAYLEQSWTRLSQQRDLSDTQLWAKVQVGTQLVSMDGYTGQTRRTQTILNNLLWEWRICRTPSNVLLEAFGHFHTAAGIAYRHFDVLSPIAVAGYSRQAIQILHSRGLSVPGQIGALRDQAKPIMRAALAAGDASRVDEAIAILNQAESLGGGAQPRQELRDEWLFTRSTMAECLAATGNADAAYRVWEDTMGASWVENHIDARRGTPLKSKMTLALIAVLISQTKYEQAWRAAEELKQALLNGPYHDRLNRTNLLMQHVTTGNDALFRNAVLK